MNSIFQNNDWLANLWRYGLGAISFCLIFVTQPVQAQLENDFRATIRDNAVIPADFQRDVQDFTDNLQAKSITTTISDNVEEFAQKTLGQDNGQSLIHGIKEQIQGLDLPRVFGSLAIVLGGYFGLVWFSRRFGGRGSGRLPNEVVEVLGQTPFRPGSNLQLIRLGNKLLLLMNSTDGTQTIGEISDPEEVAILCAKCGVPNPINKHVRPRTQTAPVVAPTNNATNTDLKQILRQLQRVADGNGNGSVFDA